MLNEEIRPTSLVGIKRLAKTIKVERRVPHFLALDEASKLAGFQNFRHAGNRLLPPGQKKIAPIYRLYITAYWKDREDGTDGRETLSVDLSAPWADLVTRRQMQMQRSLGDLVSEGPDHLVYRNLVSSQLEGRRVACAAVRTFQFIEATKLQPSKSHSRGYPGGRSSNAVPGRDHSGTWYHPETKSFIFIDEPYESAANAKAANRAEWSVEHGFEIVKPSWPGMYNPGGEAGSRLYLIAPKDKSTLLRSLAASLDQLPPPVLKNTWSGESAPRRPRFRSPGEIAQAEAPAKVLEPQRITTGHKPASASKGAEHKPGRMPIEVHEYLGRLLKSVLASTRKRSGVYNRMNVVRSELDNWIQREYGASELSMDRFVEVYYGSAPPSTYPRSMELTERDQHIQTLRQVKSVLAEHYPDTKMRSLLKKIDSAIGSLETWTT